MKFGIAGNLAKPTVPQIARDVISRFQVDRTDFIVESSLADKLKKFLRANPLKKHQIVPRQKLASACDILISLGGDGTILQMARLVAEKSTPILGVNVGKLGFLAEVSVDEVGKCLREIIEGKYVLQERMMLLASTRSARKTYAALNDIVVDKYGSPRVIDFETYVNDEYLATFSADGVIFSTPTGSTAYALANGGPIVIPTNRVITISPICPHTLTVRPVIVPDDSIIRLKVARAPQALHLTADGQDEMLLQSPVEITIQRAPFAARLVKRMSTSYFEVLRRKLQWGRDVRVEGGKV